MATHQQQSFHQPFSPAQNPSYIHQHPSFHPYATQPAHPAPLISQSSSSSLFQPGHQSLQQHPHPPNQQYNHYSIYQPGSSNEIQFQRQQYQHYQHTLQHQNQNQNQRTSLTRPPSNLPALNSLRDWFDAVDTDHSGGLSCEELQRALMNGDGWTPFNVETVRMMMNMFDRDGNGSISFNEFIGLWNYIEKWKACFQAYDLDGSGTIDANELHRALRGFGYNLSEPTVSLIMTKYDVRGRGDISFDNFVQSCVTVQTLTDAFRRIDVAGTGVVTMTYEQFLGLVINNR
ncbi:hypothetical protein EDD21DRAFT_371412 [Dissophora ornata]|nr:Alpha-1 3/1 6-mannosyltransferase alg-2 [Dissophora ornata]KAI8602605.1 hypothetical protein EDD21DRAFT_371412 [Dissophora ornata]